MVQHRYVWTSAVLRKVRSRLLKVLDEVCQAPLPNGRLGKGEGSSPRALTRPAESCLGEEVQALMDGDFICASVKEIEETRKWIHILANDTNNQ